MRYKNGNAVVSLDLRDGTRIVENDNEEYRQWYTGEKQNDEW